MDEAWAHARAIAARQRWLITAQQAQAAGLSPAQVSTALRAGAWLALLRGVYLVDADMYDDMPQQAWWQAALLAHGSNACLVGRVAARAHDAQGLPLTDPEIDLALTGSAMSRPPRIAESPGDPVDGPSVVVRQWPVAETDVVVIDGLRVRSARSSVVDAALQLDRAHALCLFDWALRAGVHTEDTLEAVISDARRRPGVAHVKAVAPLADARAASPLESRVRLACIDGEVAPDELQYVVRDRWEAVVAIGDLAWLKRRERPLIAEADGKDVHSLPAAVLHDRRRGNSLVIETCDVIRFTWADAMRPTYIQQVVRRALAA